MFASIVYLLCALTSLGCAILLHRGFRRSRAPMLLWSALCFWGFFFSNILLFVPVERIGWILVARQIPALLGIAFLLYGLLWKGTD